MLNEAWADEHGGPAAHPELYGRKPKKKQPGPIARGIAAAGIVGAVGSSTGNPRQSDTTAQKNWGDSSLRTEGARQGRAQRGATRDQGNRNAGSGQE